MVNHEVTRVGLAALNVAAAEPIEDHHEELAASFPDHPGDQLERMQRVGRLGPPNR